jgi:hypothetical protein
MPKPTSTTASRTPLPSADPNFAPMVRRAVLVSLIGWITKVGVMVKVARDVNGETHVRRWGPGIPYLAFKVPRSDFMIITSKSTVALGFVMLALLVVGILHNHSRIHVAGWCFAMVVLGYSLAVDLLLHRWIGNYTDLRRLRWAVGAFSLSSLLVAWWVAVENPHSRLVRWRNALEVSDREENFSLGEVSE